jgi:lysophospholipase L1-like esterase
MQKTIKKVASLTEIPPYHVVNAWSIIRDPKKSNVASDNVHPNAQGMGDIAQEFFMKMSMSPFYLAR